MKHPFRIHRLFQFSLRSSFLLMTTICIWLGIQVNAVRHQEAIVAAIEEAGGEVRYDWELDENYQKTGAKHPPGPEWLRRRIGDDYFQKVVAVFVTENPYFRDEHLPPIEQLPALRMLALDNTQISDAALPRIAQCRRLTFLDIAETNVTDAGMESVAQLRQLKDLWVGDWARGTVGDHGMKKLVGLAHLERLYLGGKRFTDASIPILERFHGLLELSMAHVAITQEGQSRLRRSLPACEITAGEP